MAEFRRFWDYNLLFEEFFPGIWELGEVTFFRFDPSRHGYMARLLKEYNVNKIAVFTKEHSFNKLFCQQKLGIFGMINKND